MQSKDLDDATEVQAIKEREPVLSTGTPFLDGLLGGGVRPGFLHLLAGPDRYLSRVLMHLSVNAFLPPEKGGAGAKKVYYLEFANHYDPYLVSKLALQRGLNPTFIHDQVLIARAFNWDQCVEIAGRYLKEAAGDDSLVVISGITGYFEPGRREHFHGLKEMVGGIKRCMEKRNVHVVATAPVAKGSTFKPHGGNVLNHLAGCVVAARVDTRPTGDVVFRAALVQHPLLAPRKVTFVDKSGNKHLKRKRRKFKRDLSTFRTLGDFMKK